jgi:hypothetical protein
MSDVEGVVALGPIRSPVASRAIVDGLSAGAMIEPVTGPRASSPKLSGLFGAAVAGLVALIGPF